MKILFLLPPSEGKTSGWSIGKEELTYKFNKPKEIAINATEKDLKCTGNRFEEGLSLNKQLCSTLPLEKGVHEGRGIQVMEAINRYTGVMFNAIDHAGMSDEAKKYFDDNFSVLSGMYGRVQAQDMIGNYKLPIETKGLVQYWKEDITKNLNESGVDYIVNLLPLSYMKMIDFKTLVPKLVNINFQVEKDGKIVKMAHWVKKIKGQWVKNICEKLGSDKNSDVFEVFAWEKIETEKTIEINILHK